jgi:hypothetical protein
MNGDVQNGPVIAWENVYNSSDLEYYYMCGPENTYSTFRIDIVEEFVQSFDACNVPVGDNYGTSCRYIATITQTDSHGEFVHAPRNHIVRSASLQALYKACRHAVHNCIVVK